MAKLTEAQYKIIADRMVEERRKYGDYLRPGHWAEVAARKVASHMDDFREEVEPLEAISASLTEENAKLLALAQELGNALCLIGSNDEHSGSTCEALNHGKDMLHEGYEPCPGIRLINKALESFKEQGFVPTNTTEP